MFEPDNTRLKRQATVLTTLFNNVKTSVSHVMVFQCIAIVFDEGLYENGMVLRRNEGRSIDAKIGRHGSLVLRQLPTLK